MTNYDNRHNNRQRSYSKRDECNKWELVFGAFMWGVAVGIALWRIPQLFALGIW